MRARREEGATLLELLVALVVAGLITAVILYVGEVVGTAANTILAFSAAQRTTLQVSYGVTTMMREAAFVQVAYPSGTNFGSGDFTLTLYQNGVMPAAATYGRGVYSGATLQQPVEMGILNFTKQPGSGTQSATWSVSYTDCPSGSTSCQTAVPMALGTVSTLSVIYPTNQDVSSGDYINSIILTLGKSYVDAHGKVQQYALTYGYHDKDLR